MLCDLRSPIHLVLNQYFPFIPWLSKNTAPVRVLEIGVWHCCTHDIGIFCHVQRMQQLVRPRHIQPFSKIPSSGHPSCFALSAPASGKVELQNKVPVQTVQRATKLGTNMKMHQTIINHPWEVELYTKFALNVQATFGANHLSRQGSVLFVQSRCRANHITFRKSEEWPMAANPKRPGIPLLDLVADEHFKKNWGVTTGELLVNDDSLHPGKDIARCFFEC